MPTTLTHLWTSSTLHHLSERDDTYGVQYPCPTSRAPVFPPTNHRPPCHQTSRHSSRGESSNPREKTSLPRPAHNPFPRRQPQNASGSSKPPGVTTEHIATPLASGAEG